MVGFSASASDSDNLVFTSLTESEEMKRSDSSDSDSVELMTLLTTPIFDFHYVISSLMTPTTTPTPTPSLVKTSL